MANVLAQRQIAPRNRPGSTETPVVDIAALAKLIANIERTQKSMLEVQNEQDMRLEQLAVNVGSLTPIAYAYPTQADPSVINYTGVYKQMALTYPMLATALEYPIPHTATWLGASQLTETMLLEESFPEIQERPVQDATTRTTEGVPIAKLLERGGSLLFLISLTSCVVWLTGDIALIHPAASVIGLLVSPCLYLMGIAARKQIAS